MNCTAQSPNIAADGNAPQLYKSEVSSDSQRIHYLDNLRAIAMLLGVFLHAGLAYAQPSQDVWLATDIRSSRTIDASIWFIHLFRMSLFYLLSGYFAKLVVQRKGVGAFLKNRAIRLLVPFLIFAPPLILAMVAVIGFAISYLPEPRGLMQLIVSAESRQTSEAAPLSTMHLWFIYYLMFFSLLAAVFNRWQFKWLDRVSCRPVVILTVIPWMMAVAAWFAGAPLPAPESFVPTWWPFVFYGLFFVGGWKLYGREQVLERLDRLFIPTVAIATLLYLPYYWLIPVLNLDQLINPAKPTQDWQSITVGILTAYLSILWTVIALLVGRKFLAQKSQFLRFVSDSSYWIYLIHLPIVLFLQTLLVPLNCSVWIKFSIVLLGTVVPAFATYLIFVRYTPLGWLLHGKRSFP